MLRQRKPTRGPGKLRLSPRGILLGALVLLSLGSSLWTLRRALGVDRGPELMNGARALRSLAPNTCAHRAGRWHSCDSTDEFGSLGCAPRHYVRQTRLQMSAASCCQRLL